MMKMRDKDVMTEHADDFDGYVDNIDSAFIYLFFYFFFWHSSSQMIDVPF